jgi:hypothetical protein
LKILEKATQSLSSFLQYYLSVDRSYDSVILTGSKRNQNYYRDLEIGRQANALILTDKFPWHRFGYKLHSVMRHFKVDSPKWIFVNYVDSYSHKLIGLNSFDCPLVGFVGDHYDFSATSASGTRKLKFFQTHPFHIFSTAYENTNAFVAKTIERRSLNFVYTPWAIDPTVFRDLHSYRKYDIGAFGALTSAKYPLRRAVRQWLEGQERISLHGSKRARSLFYGDHDGIQFNKVLNHCFSGFTCASTMSYVLMKYFEIPGSGALLFGQRTEELDRLGFRDSENYVAVDQDSFKKKIGYYLSAAGRQEAEIIRKSGYSLIHEFHNWPVRVKSLLKDLEALI